MPDWTLSELVSDTQGTLVIENEREILGFSIDSRTINPHEVFFALKGENFNGNEFIPQAVEKNASVIITNSSPPKGLYAKGPAWIVVEDPLVALHRIARGYRNRHKGRFLALTGSNGKTTTKEMLIHLFSKVNKAWGTSGNFNNHIGLPLNLVRIPSDAGFAILEMGMNHAGEIRFLAEIARPESGLITNIGPAHIEFLKSLSNIALAKAELIENLPSEGFAILNGDDQFFTMLSQKTPAKVFSFGTGSHCDLRGTDLTCEPFGIRMRVTHKETSVSMVLNLLGKHNAQNVLSALAMFVCYGYSLKDGAEAMATFKPVNSRMESHQIDGLRIILDCYNANPFSMQCAVEFLASCDGRRVAVLGDMRELGNDTEKMHEELGRLVADKKLDQLVGVGPLSQNIVEGALLAGMAPEGVHSCRNSTEANKLLSTLLRTGDTVLLKASRGMHFENIVKELWPSIPCDLH